MSDRRMRTNGEALLPSGYRLTELGPLPGAGPAGAGVYQLARGRAGGFLQRPLHAGALAGDGPERAADPNHCCLTTV